MILQRHQHNFYTRYDEHCRHFHIVVSRAYNLMKRKRLILVQVVKKTDSRISKPQKQCLYRFVFQKHS